MEDCPVCWDKQPDVQLPCGHQFCSECTPRLTRCPFCRTPIPGKEKHLEEEQGGEIAFVFLCLRHMLIYAGMLAGMYYFITSHKPPLNIVEIMSILYVLFLMFAVIHAIVGEVMFCVRMIVH